LGFETEDHAGVITSALDDSVSHMFSNMNLFFLGPFSLEGGEHFRRMGRWSDTSESIWRTIVEGNNKDHSIFDTETIKMLFHNCTILLEITPSEVISQVSKVKKSIVQE